MSDCRFGVSPVTILILILIIRQKIKTALYAINRHIFFNLLYASADENLYTKRFACMFLICRKNLCAIKRNLKTGRFRCLALCCSVLDNLHVHVHENHHIKQPIKVLFWRRLLSTSVVMFYSKPVNFQLCKII